MTFAKSRAEADGGAVRTGAGTSVDSWRVRPASAATLATSATSQAAVQQPESSAGPMLRFPADCGAISLFCPACYNGLRGWHPTETGYGLAGAQALAFPRERAFEFLAHPWTVNHRRSASKSQDFKGDRLHHIDGVVGEWCRRTRLQVYTHSPSLSQHIGQASLMYPGFQGKPERRFANSFPGESVDALSLRLR